MGARAMTGKRIVALGILPDVEGGIPAARLEHGLLYVPRQFRGGSACGRSLSPGWEARLYVRQGCLTLRHGERRR